MTLRDWLVKEPFTLTLSSGFFGFFAHAGLISVLEDEAIRPERITGCSAGALTGAAWAAGLSAAEMTAFFTSVNKSDFWDPGIGLGLLKGEKFRQLLHEMLPVQNLEDCPTPIAISTHRIASRQANIHQTGSLPQIVSASCAIPPLFQPVKINQYLHWDGAFTDRPGLAGAPDGCRVLYHHLRSRSAHKDKLDYLGSHRDRLTIQEISIADIPKVNPNQLANGPEAFDRVRAVFRDRLDVLIDSLAVNRADR